MKNIILGLVAVVSLNASAHLIEGTQVLKGKIKTKIMVNTVKTTCSVKIEKVKNLMLEDSYGNPAYNVRAVVGLDGDDYQRGLSIKHDKELWFNNLFAAGTGTEVRDFDYKAADGSTLKIDREGRIKSTSFPFQGRVISCSF